MLTLSALPNECPLTSNDVLGLKAVLSPSVPLLFAVAVGRVRNSRVRIARTKSFADGVGAAAPPLTFPLPSLLSLFFLEVEVGAGAGAGTDADVPPLEGDDALLVTRLLSVRVSFVRRELRPRRKGRLRGRCVCGDDPDTLCYFSE